MLFAKTVQFLPAQVVGPLSQFGATILWAYFLVPAELGIYAIVWAVQELVLLLTLSWWSAYVLRYFTSYDTPAARLRFESIEISVQVLSAFLQTVIAVAVLVALLDATPTPNLIAATVAFTLTRNITSHFADRARTELAVGPYTVLQSVGPLLGLLFGAAAMWHYVATAEALLWSYALAQGFGLVIALPRLVYGVARPVIDRAILARAWSFGLPLMLGNVFSWVSVHGIRVIVEHEMGPAALGLLTVGWWLGQRAATFGGLLVLGAAYSIAVESYRVGGKEKALPQLATNGALLLTILSPLVVAMFVLNDRIVDAVIAEAYRDVTRAILPWATLAGALTVFRGHSPDQCFMVFQRPKFDAYTAFLDATVTVLACYAGLKLGGLAGAVYGCVAGALFSTCVSLVVARTLFGFYLRIGDVARIVGATVAMAVGLIVTPLPAGLVGLATAAVFGGALFFGALALFFPSVTRKLRLQPKGSGP